MLRLTFIFINTQSFEKCIANFFRSIKMEKIYFESVKKTYIQISISVKQAGIVFFGTLFPGAQIFTPTLTLPHQMKLLMV